MAMRSVRSVYRQVTQVIDFSPNNIKCLRSNNQLYSAYSSMSQVIDEPKQDNSKVAQFTHHSYLLTSAQSLKEISMILNDIEKLKFGGTKKHYNRAIIRLGQLGEIKEAIKLPLFMNKLGTFNETAINSACMTALILCREQGKPDLADSLLVQMEKIGGKMKPDILHYREVILCCNESNLVKIMEILERLSRNDCVPDVHCYNAALTRICQSSNTNLAFTVLNSMRSVPNCAPTLYSYNTVLSSLARHPKGKKHLASSLVFQTMPSEGILPDEFSYCIAMTVATKDGDWELALELYASFCEQEKQMDMKGRKKVRTLPLRIFKSVLMACSAGGEAQTALEMINYLNKNENELKSRSEHEELLACYNMAISACANGREIASALSIYEYLDDHPILRPDIYTCTAAIYACSVIGDWETASALLFTAENIHGIRPSMFMYTTVMNAYCNMGKWEEAEALLEIMMKLSQNSPISGPTDIAFEILFRGGFRAEVSAPVRKWFKKWIELKQLNDIGEKNKLCGEKVQNEYSFNTFSSALNACIASQDWDMALQVLESVRDLEYHSVTNASSSPIKDRGISSVKRDDSTPENKWLSSCDSLLMGCLSYATRETTNKVVKELARHSNFYPHHLVATHLKQKYNQNWGNQPL